MTVRDPSHVLAPRLSRCVEPLDMQVAKTVPELRVTPLGTGLLRMHPCAGLLPPNGPNIL
jgi:hypothetical protein